MSTRLQAPSWLGLALVLAVGVWPHLYVLPLSPVSRDDVVWITRSAVSSPDWVEWVFQSEHFVGFRPVTALSYTLDSAIGGFAMPAYRATDLLLHLACALALYGVYRRLLPRLPAWGGLVASAFLMLHPVTGLVVPHLARRAYPLATLGSLLGLFVLLGPRTRFRGVLAALLLGAGALANEAAYVAFPVAALLLALREPRRAAALDFAPSAVVALLLVAHRFWLLGGAGGYAVERGGRWLPIVGATWQGLLGLDVLRTGATPIPEALAAVVGLAVLALLAAATLRSPSRDAALVLWAWVVGLTLIYAPQGVFFPRQLYVPLAPLALLVGIAAANHSSPGPSPGSSSPGPRNTRVGLAAVVALGLLVLRQSPVLWGADPVQSACWRAHDAFVREMTEDLRDLPPRTQVTVAAPYYRRPEMEALRARDEQDSRFLGRQGLTWVGALNDLKFGSATLVWSDPLHPAPIGRLEEGRVLVLADGAEIANLGQEARLEQTGGGAVVRLPSDAKVLYFHDGTEGRLVNR